jgi:large subunit ribosomal protein L6
MMSRIGKKPIMIPDGVKVEQKGTCIKVTGAMGTLEIDCQSNLKVKIDNSQRHILVVNEQPQIRQNRQLHGTMHALLANMVMGVNRGFEKTMEIYGTGYGVKEQGGKLILQVGFCNPVERVIPKGIKVKIEAGVTRGDDVPARFTVWGIDKALVGHFAAEIRKIRPPEPYKGKGIRYSDEYIKRKVGKAFTSGAV